MPGPQPPATRMTASSWASGASGTDCAGARPMRPTPANSASVANVFIDILRLLETKFDHPRTRCRHLTSPIACQKSGNLRLLDRFQVHDLGVLPVALRLFPMRWLRVRTFTVLDCPALRNRLSRT